MYSLIVLAASSFLLTLVLTPLVRDLARKRGWVDDPDGVRHRHDRPVPRIGGLAIAFSYLGALVVLLFSDLAASEMIAGGIPLALKILPAALLILALGLLDDLKGLRPWQKLAGQLLAAFLVFWAGVRITGLNGLTLDLWISLPVTLLWLVGCSNAFNLLDGVDGVAAGAGLFATVTIVIAALLHENIPLALATVPLAGSLLGFLRYNFHPASVFLGDSGSLLIGFLLGCYAIIWSQKSATLLGMTAPLMTLAIPILDTLLSILRRLLRGQSVFEGDRGHIHHRLLDRGLTPRRVALLLYGACGLFAILSLVQTVSQDRYTGLIIVLFCAVAWIGVQNLGYVEFGIARRLLFGGAFQTMLNSQLVARTFAESLARARTAEDCWKSLSEAAPKLGFARVKMCLNGKTYEKQMPAVALAESWTVTVPLSPNDWVNLTRELRSPVLPTIVTPFLDTVREELPSKLMQLETETNALSPDTAELRRRPATVAGKQGIGPVGVSDWI